MSSARLNKIAQIISARAYLEIGVQQGLTFVEIDTPFKVAVDPIFRFDFRQIATQRCIFFEKTSDSFFTNDLLDEKFDLIFLDGLHTFDQTMRDFCASISRSHENTVWLIDDVMPTGYLASCPNSVVTQVARRVTRHTSWMGDVYKVIFAIHDFFPQYSYATFPGHGQTVVWREMRKHFRPTWNSFARIAKMNYFDFLRHRSTHLFVQDEEKILQLLADNYGKRRPIFANEPDY